MAIIYGISNKIISRGENNQNIVRFLDVNAETNECLYKYAAVSQDCFRPSVTRSHELRAGYSDIVFPNSSVCINVSYKKNGENITDSVPFDDFKRMLVASKNVVKANREAESVDKQIDSSLLLDDFVSRDDVNFNY